jgi:hypothetical protein
MESAVSDDLSDMASKVDDDVGRRLGKIRRIEFIRKIARLEGDRGDRVGEVQSGTGGCAGVSLYTCRTTSTN